MDLTSMAIMVATCVFFFLGLTTLSGSLALAAFGTVGLALALATATRMMGVHSL
ncbi:hypothetical protein ACWEVD_26610 [Nocardia thailandica]